MTISEGMSLAPWGALGGGQFKTRSSGKYRRRAQNSRRRHLGETTFAVSKVLEKIAKEKNTAITSVALAYVNAEDAVCVPDWLVGGRLSI